jgi:hypothetical protein
MIADGGGDEFAIIHVGLSDPTDACGLLGEVSMRPGDRLRSMVRERRSKPASASPPSRSTAANRKNCRRRPIPLSTRPGPTGGMPTAFFDTQLDARTRLLPSTATLGKRPAQLLEPVPRDLNQGPVLVLLDSISALILYGVPLKKPADRHTPSYLAPQPPLRCLFAFIRSVSRWHATGARKEGGKSAGRCERERPVHWLPRGSRLARSALWFN